MSGWIGVDLDGTLARYDGWAGIDQIGAPLQPMVDRIKNWIADGYEVRIVTARVAPGEDRSLEDVALAKEMIQNWLVSCCDLPRLEVTCQKDFGMIQLWDDRAVQVVSNVGTPIWEN